MSEALPGRRIAGRYLLKKNLGSGGQGEVFEAFDQLSGEIVALKLMHGTAARIRREVSTLRLLRLPGVVRFIDEGHEEGVAFLVMERLEGLAFPGLAVPCRWQALEQTLKGLLMTLSQIHAAGVVHRDIKPANVLVDSLGHPTVLDFGLSYTEAPQQIAITLVGEILGTPAYLAPEQINGDSPTPQTDLYAVGVMLYEALSGHLPHEANDLRSLMRSRLMQRPVPLTTLVPDLPTFVSSLVDKLLATEAHDRPRSAAEVSEMLSGQQHQAAGKPPWLGSRSKIEALLVAAVTGQSLQLSGQTGSGKTRCLQEAANEISSRGWTTSWILPGTQAFSSLAPIVGTLAEHEADDLAQVEAFVYTKIQEELSKGVILLVDDVEGLDDASAEVLRRCLSSGSILTTKTRPGEQLISLCEEDLQQLFSGPDRILHLREDAARLLWSSSRGVPALVFSELEAWQRSGLARRTGEQWVINRESIERLEVRAPLRLRKTCPSLHLHQEELLAWVALASPRASRSLLSQVTKQPRWKIEAEIKSLIERELLYQDPEGGLETLVEIEPRWSSKQRQAAHLAVADALMPGTEGRLLHLIAGADERNAQHKNNIVCEAIKTAQHLLQKGKAGKAEQAVSDGTQALRKMPGSNEQLEALLGQWVEVALFQGTPAAFDRILYELCRSPQTATLSQLEAMIRAALAIGTWSAQALQLINAVKPFPNPALERWRQGVRVLSARRCSLAQEEAVLDEVKHWAKASPHPEAKISYASWLGRLRYRQGRFEEAAYIQATVAKESPSAFGRLSALLNGASALLEALCFEEAAQWAHTALQLAKECRHSYFEGRAEWVLRAAAYRNGEALIVDKELLEAATALPLPEVEGLITMTEAAISWRAGDLALARELSGRLRVALSSIGEPFIVLLVGSLELACGASRSPDDIAAIIHKAVHKAPPAVALQILGLLAMGGVSIDKVRARFLSTKIPQQEWRVRREVLSIEEALLAVNIDGVYG